MRLPARSASGSSDPSHAPATSATAVVVVASSAAAVHGGDDQCRRSGGSKRAFAAHYGAIERIELRGGGGEPVDFARTLLSHGVADLPPNAIARDGSALETVLEAGGSAWVVRVTPDGPAAARIEADSRARR